MPIVVRAFFGRETAGGIILLVTTAVALVWANLPWGDTYDVLWDADPILGESLRHWIGDGLMAIFFFAIGLEIKRELVTGDLATPRRAALPIVAAFGGAALPALVFLAINRDGPGADGWGVPMATDPAFALGLLALLGNRVPAALAVFLAALAIVDDVVAVLVIAVFYTDDLAWVRLAVAAGLLALLIGVNRAGVRSPLPYVVVGVALWAAVLDSGIHPTVAGVCLALGVPAQGGSGRAPSLVERLEHAVQPWVAFAIVPLFALTNAGVALGGDALANAGEPVAVGVALGLLLGKPAGIVVASAMVLRAGIVTLPAGVGWLQLWGVGWLGGIGFTTALFIAELAFEDGPSLGEAKLGILAGSLAAAVIGSLLLVVAGTRRPQSVESIEPIA